jgi:transglutaminase-like putative cysteine protease
MRYSIRHVTRFTYESPITESVMEARMQPRTDHAQRCLQFSLLTSPSSRVITYRDHDNNVVHHFNIPGRHARLTVTTEALVECLSMRSLPHRLGPAAWTRVDAMASSGQWWEYLAPSTFVQQTEALATLRAEIGLERGNDPLVALRRLMGEMYARFEYSPRSTRVDSPIDEALGTRKGVCQDFAHIFLSLVRPLGIPARYVSGYLFQTAESRDRSADGATHAWVEVLLPDLGWVGLDPTNNLIADDRHVRVAIGRDYADVPPTRGVFKGVSAVRSELSVSVAVGPVFSPLSNDLAPFTPWLSRDSANVIAEDDGELARQQQQKQQQQQELLGAWIEHPRQPVE